MKKYGLVIGFIIILSFLLNSQEPVLTLGKIKFPRPFIHAQKDYPNGIYRVFLTPKSEEPYFKVFNKKNEFLFDELAIVRPYKGKSKKFKTRIVRSVLRGYEYFRLKVTTPENVYLAFFLLKKKDIEKQEKPDKQEETQTDNVSGQ
jgi:hypothetical protein